MSIHGPGPVGRHQIDVDGLVAAALSRYGCSSDATLSPLAASFNTVLRVDAPDGRRVLRVGPRHPVHENGASELEARWTSELAGAGLPVPRVLRSLDGAASVVVKAGDGPRDCSLLEWTEGDTPSRPLDDAGTAALGALAARLHEAAEPSAVRPSGALTGARCCCSRFPTGSTI